MSLGNTVNTAGYITFQKKFHLGSPVYCYLEIIQRYWDIDGKPHVDEFACN